jgi:hypothetical protein
MREHWANTDVVAWTEHDGPGRPPAGPPDRWYRGLAAAFAGWFVLAVVGCEVIHHSGGDHVPITPPEAIAGTAVLLGLPAMIVLLAQRSAPGAWFAAALGALAAGVSLTQWSLAPVYTAIEAGGFLVLALAGVALGIAQWWMRRAPAAIPTAPPVPAGASRPPAVGEPVAVQ